jgi:hypothetical protein
MRAFVAGLLIAAVAACGPRRVEVQTGPQPAAGSEVGLHVTNNASQAVNVYVVSGGNSIFVGQVSAGSSQHLTVSGVPSGSTVRLEAREVSGNPPKVYSKDNVVLSGTMTPWQVP